jgi:DNA modification methylase
MRDGVAATNAGQLRHWAKRTACETCGATKTDRQIGLEPSPDEYVAGLVAVFREVRRVLRDDGTVWLNLGDSYASSTVGVNNNGQGASTIGYRADGSYSLGRDGSPYLNALSAKQQTGRRVSHGCKPKDLLGIPWMVAFALRADGWYLRSDIIWNKANPMPESVTDRPTKAHEYLFLLSKGPRYFYDADAIREPSTFEVPVDRALSNAYDIGSGRMDGNGHRSGGFPNEGGRNKRSVWTVATQPFPGAHFATFPPKLIEPCVLAGSSPKCCGVCGAPWQRVVERESKQRQEYWSGTNRGNGVVAGGGHEGRTGQWHGESRTLGWESSCQHEDDIGRSVVLDPFAGAGTTGVVSRMHDRRFIGIELNPAYAEMARERIRLAEPQGWQEALL